MSNRTVLEGQRLITPGQVKDLAATLAQAVPTDLSFEAAERWLGSKRLLHREVRKRLMDYTSPYAVLMIEWRRFYWEMMDIHGMTAKEARDESAERNLHWQSIDGIEKDIVPEPIEGFDGLIVVAESVTLQKIIEAFEKRGVRVTFLPESHGYNLLGVCSDRTNMVGPYAVWTNTTRRLFHPQGEKDATKFGAHLITLKEALLFILKSLHDSLKFPEVVNQCELVCGGSHIADIGKVILKTSGGSEMTDLCIDAMERPDFSNFYAMLDQLVIA